MVDQIPMFKANIESKFNLSAEIILYPGIVEDLLPTIPSKSVQLIITSPPYNIGKEYETRTGLTEYLGQQKSVIAELYRTLKSTGSICWQVGNYVENGEVFPLDIYFYPIFKDLGMQLRNRIVWHFGHGLHASKRLSGRYETLLWFTKSEEYTFNLDEIRVPSKYPGKRHYKGPNKGKLSGNPKGKNPSDVWDIVAQDWENAFWEIPNTKSNHTERTEHPAQFPIALAERCILACSEENDWVFDPYSGVGTSLVAAIKRGRKALGAEKEESYVKIAKERIQSFYSGNLPYRPLGKPIYKPSGKTKISKVPEKWKDVEEGVY